MKDDYVLAIDNGTQSVRTLVFGLDGQLVARYKVDIEAYFSAEPGWAEQEPGYYWDSLCRACNGLWPQLEIPKSAIKAVALTTQRSTVINVDGDGKPLRPAIVWLDQRQQRELPGMGLWDPLFTLLGQKDAIEYFRSQSEINWIRAQQPEIWMKTAKYLLLSGYLTHRLTGDYVDSVASQVGYLPFDFRKRAWARRGDWKWKALPVRRDMLPRLVPCGAELGRITARAAKETGLPEGLPLISAGADKACEVLGAGCVTADSGSLSYGTTATYNCTYRKYVEAVPHMPAYPAAVPGGYTTEVMVQRGYWMVNWFKREFGLREERIAAERGIEPEVLFDDLLKEVPPGSMGLVLQPYWTPGIRTPGPEAKGAIIGFGDVHTRAHIYRAIIEGIAYALREGKERLERRSGTKITTLRVSGGGSQSDQAMQITADVFGMAAERPHTYEASGLGAAINAAVGVGLHPDYPVAVERMTHVGDRFEPDAENQALYDRLYHEVYQKMYARLGLLYKAIRRITGYPR